MIFVPQVERSARRVGDLSQWSLYCFIGCVKNANSNAAASGSEITMCMRRQMSFDVIDAVSPGRDLWILPKRCRRRKISTAQVETLKREQKLNTQIA